MSFNFISSFTYIRPIFAWLSSIYVFFCSLFCLRHNITVVSTPSYNGLILSRIARVILSSAPPNSFICNRTYFLQPSRCYILIHHALLPSFITNNRFSNLNRVCLWYTHEDYRTKVISKFNIHFKNLMFIFCTNNRLKEFLISEYGIPKEKILVFIGGYDENIYNYCSVPKLNDRKLIGLVSRADPRKNPVLLINLIKISPQLDFLLIGSNWENWDYFTELVKFPNFYYVNPIDFKDLAFFYHEFDVFLSLSTNEGGPIPLLEAMASGCCPVVSDVGFSDSVIINSKNGFTFSPYSNVDEISSIISLALLSNISPLEISNSVSKFTWDYLGLNIVNSVKKFL